MTHFFSAAGKDFTVQMEATFKVKMLLFFKAEDNPYNPAVECINASLRIHGKVLVYDGKSVYGSLNNGSTYTLKYKGARNASLHSEKIPFNGWFMFVMEMCYFQNSSNVERTST